MKILIKKIETLENAPHPNACLPADYETIRETNPDMFSLPKVGESFTVMGPGGWFTSSTVTEILEENETSGKFKTLNSIYYWEILLT